MPRNQCYPPTTGPRNRRFEISVSDDEYQEIQTIASTFGRSAMDYGRLRLLNHDHVLVPVVVEVSDDRRQAEIR